MNLNQYVPIIPKPVKAALKPAQEVGIILVSALLVAAGLNLFLIPHKLLSGGLTGLPPLSVILRTGIYRFCTFC